MADENQEGVDALEKLRNDLRFPMADVRQILENFTICDWKCVLVVGNGTGNALLMADEGVGPDDIVSMIEDAFSKGQADGLG